MAAQKPFEPKDILQRPTFEEDRQTIIDSLRIVSSKYELSKVSSEQETRIVRELSGFEAFEQYGGVFLFGGVELGEHAERSFLAIVSLNAMVPVFGKRYIRQEPLTELEFIGLARLSKDYGQVFIRPETFADKLNELTGRTEVDFEMDKAFSRRYFVLTTDEQKLRMQMTSDFLAAINKHNGLEIEISGRKLMIRLRQRISVQAAETVADFLMDLENI